MADYLRETRMQLRWKRWSYDVEAVCGFTDGEHEIRKPVQVMDKKSHCSDTCSRQCKEHDGRAMLWC